MSAAAQHSGRAQSAAQERLCRSGCGRMVAPGTNPKTSRPYSTCCRSCGVGGKEHHDAECDKRNGISGIVVVRVMKGCLVERGEEGKFSCRVNWCYGSDKGRPLDTSPAMTADGADIAWNCTVVAESIAGASHVSLELEVFRSQNWLGWVVDSLGTIYGRGRKPLSELLPRAVESAGGPRGRDVDTFAEAPTTTLDIFSEGGQNVGSVQVQCIVAPLGSARLCPPEKVDPALFQMPVCSVAKSGGTAAFYELLLQPGARDKAFACSPALPAGHVRSEKYFIGKDRSHALLELDFYEAAAALSLRPQEDSEGLYKLHPFFFEYLGVLEAPVVGSEELVELLVLRNLFDGCDKLRMLDVKIGDKTADAGWQGKSHFKALPAQFRDLFTNSAREGYRLAGFNGEPMALKSRDPLTDLRQMFDTVGVPVQGDGSKARRVAKALLSGADMFEHFLDMQEYAAEVEARGSLDQSFLGAEVAEITMHEVVSKLVAFVSACRCVIAPQKWVGSSVGLAFDCQRTRSRRGGEHEVREAVKVNAFDWGRSELNSVARHKSLSEVERHDRATFWDYYVHGAFRLAWEAARTYWHRYCNDVRWELIELEVFDYDSLTSDDSLGRVTVPLVATPLIATVQLEAGTGTLTYSIAQRSLPQDSRLKEVWDITLHKASGLCAADSRGTSDPYVIVRAASADRRFCFVQRTSVKEKTLDPIWVETVGLSVAREGQEQLRHALCTGQSRHMEAPTDFPIVGGDQDEAHELKFIDFVCGGVGSTACRRQRSSLTDDLLHLFSR